MSIQRNNTTKLLALAITGSVFAEGTAVYVVGKAVVRRDTQTLPLSRGDRVLAGDIVQTMRGATLIVKLSDGVFIKLRPGSRAKS